jgi:hypothetical protein
VFDTRIAAEKFYQNAVQQMDDFGDDLTKDYRVVLVKNMAFPNRTLIAQVLKSKDYNNYPPHFGPEVAWIESVLN